MNIKLNIKTDVNILDFLEYVANSNHYSCHALAAKHANYRD